MRTESLLCIAIPRVSAIFFTFQGNRLSCTTELYQPQCQPAPHWPPKCNGYDFLVHVLTYRTIRFDSGESMHTRNSLRGIYFLMIFYLVQNSQNKSEDIIGKSILQNQYFSFKFGITEDKCIFILQEKPKRKTSGYPHVVAK